MLTVENILDETIDDGVDPTFVIKDKFAELFKLLWADPEGFNGKRPFGNSGWKQDIVYTLEEKYGQPADEISAMIDEAVRIRFTQ